MPMLASPLVLPDQDVKVGTETEQEPDSGFLVVCWNDPVNLMDYVTHVFRVVLGWNKAKAEKHMMEVHNKGKSVLIRESREKAEAYVHQLQRYSLHATMEPGE